MPSIKVQFDTKNLSAGLEPDEAQKLYKELLNGSTEAKEKIILSHIRFGIAIVAGLNTWNADQQAELVSTMLESLVDGVDRIQKGAITHHEIPNMTGYLGVKIRGELLRALTQDSTVTVSNAYFRKALNKPRRSTSFSIDDKQSVDLSGDDILELIETCIKTPTERYVIHARAEGKKDPEIALELGITKAGVNLARNQVKTRFMEKLSCLARD